MKIAHVITTIERGGAENAVLTLAEIQRENGYEVIVIPLKGKPELLNAFRSLDVQVDDNMANLSFARQILRLRHKFSDENVILHGHLPRAELLIRISFPFRRFFVTRHNSEHFFPLAPKLVSQFLSRFVTYRTHSIIAISEAVKEFLIKNKENSKNSNCKVIYYGYKPQYSEMKQFLPNIHATKSESHTLSLITVGRLEQQKNTQMLIKLLRLMVDKGVNSTLKILGEGRERTLLEKLVDNLGLRERVTFLGRHPDVLIKLRSADIFVFASNYEGFGLVLLEAMDSGIPIIAPNHSCIPEVLGVDHAGLYTPNNLDESAKIINCILERKGFVEEICEYQTERLKMFSVEKYFKQHHEIYLNYIF
jgi:glycosyltransferase involved in cell wall biosynthesis